MKLAILSVDAFPQVGGISVMAHHLANAFVENGIETVMIAPKGAYVPTPHKRKYWHYEDIDSDKNAREGDRVFVEDSRLKSMLAAVREDFNFDRLFLLHPFYYGVAAVQYSRETNIPCSIYCHGFEMRSQMLTGIPDDIDAFNAKNPLMKLRDRAFYTVGEADEIVVNSHYTRDVIQPLIKEKEIIVTGCGISQNDREIALETSPEYDAQERIERRKTLGLSDKPMMTFIGRLVPSKKADRLVEIAAETPDLQIVLVGEGPHFDALKSLTDTHDLSDRVHFAGFVDEAKKWDYLHASDFVALMSQNDDAHGQMEGFGIVLLEAAAVGAIPVSSGNGGMTDVIAHGDTGLILQSDMSAKQAGEILMETYGEADVMRRINQSARDQIGSKYNWKTISSDLIMHWEKTYEVG